MLTIFHLHGMKNVGTVWLEINIYFHYYLSFLSLWRMGPLILLFQSTRSFAATSASRVLNPRCSLSLLIVLRHVSLGRPLRRLPSGAHVSAILGFWSEDILSTWPSHFHLLALTFILINFNYFFSLCRGTFKKKIVMELVGARASSCLGQVVTRSLLINTHPDPHPFQSLH